MSDLRTGAIEALHAETETWGYKAGVYELQNEAHEQLLDALLDYLEAHTEEWEEMVHVRRRVWAAEAWAARDPDHDGFESFAVSLVAALRLVDQEPADPPPAKATKQ